MQLVLTQIGQIQPRAAHQRAVVAHQLPVQALEHRPLQPTQQALGLAMQRRTGGPGAWSWRRVRWNQAMLKPCIRLWG